MTAAFYISSIVAIFSSLMVISRKNAFSALLYMIISLLSVAVIFFVLGAVFVAALEVIIYAGAIMVLFVFVTMMLNLGEEAERLQKTWMRPAVWIGPSILALILGVEVILLITSSESGFLTGSEIGPKEVGIALYGKYIIGVELAALLITAGIVGAYHLGKRKDPIQHRYLQEEKGGAI
ncbi:MAG: NADH-quinone oxidoreductase subunit J [Lentimicrobium sp.]|jgi:NADH-quinone oxidoreductase subunit J|nr:NADH-quinone oxidoreductase subunit J [Lentimicrobium sp.]